MLQHARVWWCRCSNEGQCISQSRTDSSIVIALRTMSTDLPLTYIELYNTVGQAINTIRSPVTGSSICLYSSTTPLTTRRQQPTAVLPCTFVLRRRRMALLVRSSLGSTPPSFLLAALPPSSTPSRATPYVRIASCLFHTVRIVLTLERTPMSQQVAFLSPPAAQSMYYCITLMNTRWQR